MNQNKKAKNKIYLSIIFILVSATAIILFFGFREKTVEKIAPAPPDRIINPADTSSTQIFFASNGKNSVYKIKKGDKWSVIWNGSEGKEYDFVSNPVFSPDGNQLAYSAEVGGQAYVVVNNQLEINAYQKGGYIVFSQNGQVIAFVASKSDGTSIIVTSSTGGSGTISGNESQAYQTIVIIETSTGSHEAIILSDNGEQVAYAIEENGQTYLVINGEQTTGYDSVSNFTFNEDGTYTYQAQQGNTTITVVNGVVTGTENSGNNPPNNNNNSGNNNNNYTGSSGTGVYKYKISTDKDISREESELDYSGCQGTDCNF